MTFRDVAVTFAGMAEFWRDGEERGRRAAGHSGQPADRPRSRPSRLSVLRAPSRPPWSGTGPPRARLRDDSLEDLDNLPAPEVIAREIVEDLTAALAEFEAVAAALEAGASPSRPH